MERFERAGAKESAVTSDFVSLQASGVLRAGMTYQWPFRLRGPAGLLPSVREYIRCYQVNEERMGRAKETALVMHPGPMNDGVEISHGLAHGARSLVESQVTNGVAVRMALLYMLASPGVES